MDRGLSTLKRVLCEGGSNAGISALCCRDLLAIVAALEARLSVGVGEALVGAIGNALDTACRRELGWDPSNGPAALLNRRERDIFARAVLAIVVPAVREAAAKVADTYATENFLLAGDTILTDPVLARKDFSPDALAKSGELQTHGCIHASMAHAAQNIASAIRAMGESAT